MPRPDETARGIAYPQLSRDQIDLIIESLLCTIRDRNIGSRVDEAELIIGKLTDFYTRRWGLPPAISRRTRHIRDQGGRWGLAAPTAPDSPRPR